jgi:predicted nucleotidyltransferase
MWVFGSRARGDHQAESDLDVAIDIDRVIPMDGDPYTSFLFEHEKWKRYLQKRLHHPVHLCLYDERVQAHFDLRIPDEFGIVQVIPQVSIVRAVELDGILIYDDSQEPATRSDA